MSTRFQRGGSVIHPSQNDQSTQLWRYLQLAWRRRWLLIVPLVAIPACAYTFSKSDDKVYEARATIQVDPTGAQPGVDAGATTRAVSSAVSLAGTATVANRARDRLAETLGRPPGLGADVTFSPDRESGFVYTVASGSDPQTVAAVANAYATATVRVRTERAQSEIGLAIRGARSAAGQSEQTEVPGAVSPTDLSLQALRIARADQRNRTQLIEPATAPGSPVSPRPVRSALLALMVALVIAAGLVFLAELLDRRLRQPEEVETLLGAPLLGVIPASAFPHSATTSGVAEAFQMLRATLMYYNVNPLQTLLVTSPGIADGKTTVATHLARALARSGKRVTLIDADLRRPQVETRFVGHETTNGLGAVLAGECELSDVRHTVDVDGGELSIVPAGTPPPNPSELLGSERMAALLEQLREESDVVIIDSTPALMVGDSIPLLMRVSGVVAVAKVGLTERDHITRLRTVIANSRGKLLGAVVTGVGDEQGYGYGYAQLDYASRSLKPSILSGRGASEANAKGDEGGAARVLENTSASHES